jgi:hypothetical protein
MPRLKKKLDTTANYFNTLGTVLLLYFSVDNWNSRRTTAHKLTIRIRN